MTAATSRALFRTCVVAGLAVPAAGVLVLVAATVGHAGLAEPLAALRRGDVRHAVGLSVATATLASVLGLGVALPAAYALSRWDFRGRRLIDVLIDVPLVVSPVALGMMVLLVFRTAPAAWVQEHLVRFVFEAPGIVLVQTILVAAMQIRILKAAFDEIPARMETVARFLGCGPWGAFLRVTLPLARPGIVCAFVLGWARAVGEYGATVTVAGSVRGKTETIPVAIVQHWNAVRIEAAVGLVLLLVVLSVAVLAAVRRVAGSRT